MSEWPSTGSLKRLSPWVAAAVAFAVYANSLANGFALDDEAIIAHNPLVHSMSGIARVWSSVYWPNTPGNVGLYRPVTIATYVIDWALWHGRPFGFHLVNVGLHAAVSALVVVLMVRLGASTGGAVLGGLLFAVHPVHVEAVSGVVGRAELLMTLLVVGACLVHLRHAWRRTARWLMVSAFFLGALLTKESAVALPALLLIVDAMDPERRTTLVRRLLDDAPLYLLLAAALAWYLLIRHSVLGVFGGTNIAAGLEQASVATRVATALRVWPEYLRLLVFPLDLVADYSPNVIVPARWTQPSVWIGLTFGAAILFSAWAFRRAAPWWTAGVAWFVASMFIVSNLVVPVGIVLAERNFYLPSVALAFVVAPLPAWLAGRGRAALRAAGVAAAGAVIVAGIIRTWTRTPVWRSTTSLLADLAATHPESYRAQSYLGDVAMRHGNTHDAVEHYAAAYGMVANPVIGDSYAAALTQTKDWPTAERVAGQSCRVDYPSPCLYLIDALMAQGKPDQAQLVVDSIAPHIAPSMDMAERMRDIAVALGDTALIRAAGALVARLGGQSDHHR